MPSYSRRRSYSPESTSSGGYTYAYAPSTAMPKAGKTVGFASNPVSSSIRPLTQNEARPLYDFEMHARACRACADPLAVHRAGRRLCPSGTSLAAGVTTRLSSARDGANVYAGPAEVELPYTYAQVRSLLRAVERSARHPRQTPIVSYGRPSTAGGEASDERRDRRLSTSKFDMPSSYAYSPPRMRGRSSSFRTDRDDRMPSLTRSPSPTPMRRRSSVNPASASAAARRASFLAKGRVEDPATESISHGLASLAVRSQNEDLSERWLRESPVAPTFSSRRLSTPVVGGAGEGLYADYGYGAVLRAPRKRSA